jgi:hypothetical protein
MMFLMSISNDILADIFSLHWIFIISVEEKKVVAKVVAKGMSVYHHSSLLSFFLSLLTFSLFAFESPTSALVSEKIRSQCPKDNSKGNIHGEPNDGRTQLVFRRQQ